MLEQKVDRVIELLEELIAVQAGEKVHKEPPSKPALAKAAGGAKGGPKGKKGPTLDELKTLCVDVSNSKKVKEGKEKIVSLIQRFGADSLKELKEEHYTEFQEQVVQIRDEGMDPREAEGGGEEDPF